MNYSSYINANCKLFEGQEDISDLVFDVIEAVANTFSVVGNSLVMLTLAFDMVTKRTVIKLLLFFLSAFSLLFTLTVVPTHLFTSLVNQYSRRCLFLSYFKGYSHFALLRTTTRRYSHK